MKRSKFLTALCLTAVTVLLPACAQIYAQADEWVPCATEGSLCRVNGEGVVRFGIEGRYEYRSVNGPVMCNTDTFGDPIQGVRKSCAVNTSGSNAGNTSPNTHGRNNGDWNRPNPNSNPNSSGNDAAGGWQTCAWEDGMCRFNGTRTVRYGVPGRYMTGTATNGMACNNQTFGGDPAPGMRKFCQVGDGNARPSGPSAGGGWEGIDSHPDGRRSEDRDRHDRNRSEAWAPCAQEGGYCRVPRTTDVRFGANGAYNIVRNVTGGIACNTGTFGDPFKGTVKQCEYAR